MNSPTISSYSTTFSQASTTAHLATAAKLGSTASDQPQGELREAFQDFVGQTFFGEMLKALRSTQQPSAYFHGGRGEEIFQGQLDQMLTEKLSEASADRIADPMFELFQMGRVL